MADFATIPPPTGLYPAPPQPQQGVLSPGNVLDLAIKMQGLQAAQNDALLRHMGNLPPNATPEEINRATLNAVTGGANQARALQLRNDLINTTGAARERLLAIISGQAQSAAGYMTPHDIVNPATGAVVSVPTGSLRALAVPPAGSPAAPAGTSPAGTLSAAPGAFAPAAPGIPGGVQTGLPTGQEKTLGGAAERANALQKTVETNPLLGQQLQQLRDLSPKIPFSGPTSQLEQNIAGLLQHIGKGVEGFPGKVTPEQLRDTEEFQKIVNLLAGNQIKLASNAGLDLAVHSNPNLTMSRYGREAIIAVLQGNVAWQDRLREAWLASGLPANQYDRWANEAQKIITPQVFQFDKMDPAAQRQFYNDMSERELENFKRNYNFAVRQRWVDLPKSMPAAPPTQQQLLDSAKRRPVLGSP